MIQSYLACPCYTGCPKGCPCETYECEPRSCEDQYSEESGECAGVCLSNQNICLARCGPFDVVVSIFKVLIILSVNVFPNNSET